MGIERSTFIINEEGILVKEYRKVKVKEHVSTNPRRSGITIKILINNILVNS